MGRDFAGHPSVSCGDWGPWSPWQIFGPFALRRRRVRQCTESFTSRICNIIETGDRRRPAEQVCSPWVSGTTTYEEEESEYQVLGRSRGLEEQIGRLRDVVVNVGNPLHYNGRMFLDLSWVDKIEGVSSHSVYLEGNKIDENQPIKLDDLSLGDNNLVLEVEWKDGTKKKTYFFFRTVNLIELTVDEHTKKFSGRVKQGTPRISFSIRVKNNSQRIVTVFLAASKVPAGWAIHLHPQIIELKPGRTRKASLLAIYRRSVARSEGKVAPITIAGRSSGGHLDATTVYASI